MRIPLILLAVCASVCLPLDYEPSRIYQYEYETEVSFTEPGSNSNGVGMNLKADVHLTPVWNRNNVMLVKLTLTRPRLLSGARAGQGHDIKSLTRFPLFFHWEGTNIARVFTVEKDSVWSTNVKVGIISLLQIQKDKGERREIDSSGDCLVTYTVKGSNILKTKSDCKSLDTSGEFYNVNPILDVDLTVQAETQYMLKDNIIASATATESYSSHLNMRDQIATAVHASQKLKFQKAETGAHKVQASTLDEAVQVISTRQKFNLHPRKLSTLFEAHSCTGKDCTGCSECSDLKLLVEKHKEALQSENLATTSSGSAFLELVEAFRKASKDKIADILHDADNAEILPQLIDVAVACQTTHAQELLMDMLEFGATDDVTLQERYLLAAAFSTHPSHKLLENMLELFQRDVPDPHLKESIGEALGACVYTYCQVAQQCKQQIITDIQKAILEKLRTCQEDNCKPMHLRALSNAGLPATTPVLLEYAETSTNNIISENAIKALRRINKNTEEVKEVMRRIFYQKKRGYDSAVRSQALKVLLQTDPTAEEVKAMLGSTNDPYETELDMYTQARLTTEAEANKTIKGFLKDALKNPEINNYHILAPKGKALAFKNSMAHTAGMDATYDMYVENSRASIMKRSGMDVDIFSSKHTLPLYSFGIFAAGLEGLLGEEVEEGQEEVEATAGLALNLIDVSLRPVTFFTGQSGLMSAVWNAPSELMSALQTNILLHDHSRRLHLQNGFVVDHNVRGVVSMDLSGSISISLWNKNCQSLIKNSGALVIRGSMAVHTPVYKTGISYMAQAATLIDFRTDVDFYDKIKMCLQMSRPAFDFTHNVTKYETGIGFRKGYYAHVRRRTHINEASYPLPKPNNKQCRILLADD